MYETDGFVAFTYIDREHGVACQLLHMWASVHTRSVTSWLYKQAQYFADAKQKREIRLGWIEPHCHQHHTHSVMCCNHMTGSLQQPPSRGPNCHKKEVHCIHQHPRSEGPLHNAGIPSTATVAHCRTASKRHMCCAPPQSPHSWSSLVAQYVTARVQDWPRRPPRRHVSHWVDTNTTAQVLTPSPNTNTTEP